MGLRGWLKRIPGLLWAVHRLRAAARGNWQEQYWRRRKRMRYYQEVLRLAQAHAPTARSVIDIGSMNSPFIKQFRWIPAKTALDIYEQGRLRGVTNIKADFLTWTPPRRYDLVLCLQVLEHLDVAQGTGQVARAGSRRRRQARRLDRPPLADLAGGDGARR